MRVFQVMRRKPLGALGGLLILVLVATALLAPALAPHDPIKMKSSERLQAPRALKGWNSVGIVDDVGEEPLEDFTAMQIAVELGGAAAGRRERLAGHGEFLHVREQDFGLTTLDRKLWLTLRRQLIDRSQEHVADFVAWQRRRLDHG